ncbi:hypothetical protein ACFLYJ_03375 [Candidatus Cloacimonadota bacterium]
MTSNVWSSVIMGAVFGYLLLSPIVDKLLQKKVEELKSDQQTEQIQTEDDQRD